MTARIQPRANLLRLSRHGLETASRHPYSKAPFSRWQTPLVAPQRRSYASEKPSDNKKTSKRERKPQSNIQKDGAQGQGSRDPEHTMPGKSAPGMEGLYGRSSPLSKIPEASSAKAEQTSSASKIPEEDEKALDEIISLFKKQMPNADISDLENAIAQMRKHGLPQEMKDVLQIWRGEKSLDLATVMKTFRVVQKVARMSAHHRLDEEKRDENEPKQKSSHDPGPREEDHEQKDKKQKDRESFFGNNEFPNFRKGIKLDMGTMISTAFLTYLLYRSLSPGENKKEISWQEFKTQFLDRGLVNRLTVFDGRKVKVALDREAVRSSYPASPATDPNFSFYFSIGDVATFERHLDEAQADLEVPSSERIPVSYADETPWGGMLAQWVPTLLLIGSTFWLIRRTGGGGGGSGLFGMGKSRAKRFNHETDIKIGFKDVAGMDEAKQEITEFVSFLKEPGIYQKLGAKIPRGAVLSGPPGTGKTLLAKATAGESGVPFYSVSGSEFVEMFVGVGASRVRDLFQNARKNTPCIIFIDEIDAIGRSRGKNNISGGDSERETTLNQILTEMDGFNTSEQVVVLAGTNRVDVLDSALLRPGRFDRHINIDRPTTEGRKQIFGVHLKKIVTKEEADHLQGRLAALTPGFSGADIANCVNEAALIAARGQAEHVTMAHFESAVERVIGGLEKKSLVLNPEEKKTVAYHEAGHAICGWYFRYADPLLKVSIIPRGQGALGYAQYLPSGDSYLMNVNQLMDRMAMTLAGRVSEEIHFETVSTGASDDFNKVTRMATSMVTKWGMSNKIGYLYFDDDNQQQLHKPFSEETAKNIDLEVRRIVDEAYKQCKDLLIEKKKEIGIVAEELLSKEMLTREDMIRLLGKRPFEEKGDFTKYFGSRGEREGAPDPKPGEAAGPPSGNDGDSGPSLPGGIGGPTPAFRRQQDDSRR